MGILAVDYRTGYKREEFPHEEAEIDHGFKMPMNDDRRRD